MTLEKHSPRKPRNCLEHTELGDCKIRTQVILSFSKHAGKVDCVDEPSWVESTSNVYFAVEIPAHWSHMMQRYVRLVELQPGHAEYDKVASAFNQTCSNFRIEKVRLLVAWSFLMVEARGNCGPGYMHFDSFPNIFLTQN